MSMLLFCSVIKTRQFVLIMEWFEQCLLYKEIFELLIIRKQSSLLLQFIHTSYMHKNYTDLHLQVLYLDTCGLFHFCGPDCIGRFRFWIKAWRSPLLPQTNTFLIDVSILANIPNLIQSCGSTTTLQYSRVHHSQFYTTLHHQIIFCKLLVYSFQCQFIPNLHTPCKSHTHKPTHHM